MTGWAIWLHTAVNLSLCFYIWKLQQERRKIRKALNLEGLEARVLGEKRPEEVWDDRFDCPRPTGPGWYTTDKGVAVPIKRLNAGEKLSFGNGSSWYLERSRSCNLIYLKNGGSEEVYWRDHDGRYSDSYRKTYGIDERSRKYPNRKPSPRRPERGEPNWEGEAGKESPFVGDKFGLA